MKNLFSPIKMGLMSLCILGLFLSSCSQEEIDELVKQNQNNTTPTPTPNTNFPMPSWSDAFGVLVATQVKAVQSSASITIGVAAAAIYANMGDSALADAGTVKVESKELTKQPNNSYAFIPTQNEPTGIAFTNPISWEVSGNGTVSAFSHDLTGSFPNADSVTSATTFDNNNAYTLTVGSLADADSVLFMVAGSSGTPLLKYLSGTSTSCTFTQAEMATIPAGTGLIQVVPMRITDNTAGGRKYYYVRQTAVSKTVTIND
jgi:hypothetical protein